MREYKKQLNEIKIAWKNKSQSYLFANLRTLGRANVRIDIARGGEHNRLQAFALLAQFQHMQRLEVR
jgi:hypothetical protein